MPSVETGVTHVNEKCTERRHTWYSRDDSGDILTGDIERSNTCALRVIDAEVVEMFWSVPVMLEKVLDSDN